MAFQGWIDIERARRAFAQIDASMGAAVDKAFARAELEIDGLMQERFRAGGASVSTPGQLRRPAGDFLFTRTGGGKGSFSFDVVRGGGSSNPLARKLESKSSGTRYMRIQEKGGTIRPVNRQWLTVPLPDNRTAGGDVRWPSAAALFTEQPGKTWVQRARSGRLFILYQEREDAKPLWLFALRKSVKIPPRLGFDRTVRGYVPTLVGVITENIERELAARRGNA